MNSKHVQRGSLNHDPASECLRQLPTARLPRSGEHRFDIRFSRTEMDEVKSLLGLLSVRRMTFKGNLDRDADGTWRLEGHLGATVVQPCVASLKPVTTRIDDSVVRQFVPDLEMPEPNTVSLSPSDDTIDPLTEVIDLVHVATEALSLGIPDYPRHNDTESVAQTAAKNDTPGPFAALAVLKERK